MLWFWQKSNICSLFWKPQSLSDISYAHAFNGESGFYAVNKKRYEKTKVAIEDLNLPFMEVDDFVEEQMKRLHEQHEQWKEQKEEAEK